jgi:hypothetical protein
MPVRSLRVTPMAVLVVVLLALAGCAGSGRLLEQASRRARR